MVTIREWVVSVINRARRSLHDEPPPWAAALIQTVHNINRKVNIIMALDANVLHRILAGAASLVQQVQAGLDREAALKQQLSDAQGTVAAEQAKDADQALVDQQANDQLKATADALEQLLQGPQTPTVETPAPDQAPDVINGNQDPVVVDPEPADGGTSADPNA